MEVSENSWFLHDSRRFNGISEAHEVAKVPHRSDQISTFLASNGAQDQACKGNTVLAGAL